MQLGFIGLGRMGHNMVLRLLEKGHSVVVYDRSPDTARPLENHGATVATSLTELVTLLKSPRVIWLMIPAGKPVDNVLSALTLYLRRGDIIIDGGNSFFKDSMCRASLLAKHGINFLDVGTSGGIEGARKGASMMIGGSRGAFKKTKTLYRDLCVRQGYGYMGKSGAGHFVKMVHNGIEYGMMGAIAEGLQAIQRHARSFGLRLEDVARVYAHGSIIQSRLMDWLVSGLSRSDFKKITGTVAVGETEEEMKKLERLAVMPILKQSRTMRAQSRHRPSLVGKLIAIMRNEFGGHAIR